MCSKAIRTSSTTFRAYTGVGSRETPPWALALTRELALALASAGWTLRSGGADGADSAFADGARMAGAPEPEIYLPWPGFNGQDSVYTSPSPAAMALAQQVHPAWDRLSGAARKLHARNCHQVLGWQLDAPSHFLVCWTADGCESAAERTMRTGGTATAIVLAERHAVPRYNLAREGSRRALREHLQSLGVASADAVWRHAPVDAETGQLF